MNEKSSQHDNPNRNDKTTSANANRETVDPRILEILVCPLTKTRLRYDQAKSELISSAAGLAYPIRDGVPMMSMEAARQLNDDEG